jgi:hypothetical protein
MDTIINEDEEISCRFIEILLIFSSILLFRKLVDL